MTQNKVGQPYMTQIKTGVADYHVFCCLRFSRRDPVVFYTIQYNTIQYDTIRYDTILYYTIPLALSRKAAGRRLACVKGG